jgi:hypothetical protein
MNSYNNGMPFRLITEAGSCGKNQGDLWSRAIVSGRWTTLDKLFWAKTGGRMYDIGATALCTILVVRYKEKEQKSNSKTL